MLFLSDIRNIVTSKRGVREMRRMLIDREECNGWTNAETWTANLWLSNEQATNDHARAICDPRHKRTKFENAHLLRDYMIELSGMGRACMKNDMLQCSLDRVNYVELALSFAEV